AWILNKFLLILNKSVVWVENIPNALMYGNHIGLLELILIYTAILVGIIWIAVKRKRWLWIFAFNVMILLVISVNGRMNNASQDQFIVYQVPGKSVINFISGKTNILISDDDFLKDESQQLYFVKHNWFAHGYVDGINIDSHNDYNHPS